VAPTAGMGLDQAKLTGRDGEILRVDIWWRGVLHRVQASILVESHAGLRQKRAWVVAERCR